jgi:hypothetical protein
VSKCNGILVQNYQLEYTDTKVNSDRPLYTSNGNRFLANILSKRAGLDPEPLILAEKYSTHFLKNMPWSKRGIL